MQTFESLKIGIVTLETSIIRIIIELSKIELYLPLSNDALLRQYIPHSPSPLSTITNPIKWNLRNANHFKLFQPYSNQWFQYEMPPSPPPPNRSYSTPIHTIRILRAFILKFVPIKFPMLFSYFWNSSLNIFRIIFMFFFIKNLGRACLLPSFLNTRYHGRVSQRLATCSWTAKVLHSSLVTNYVQR